MNLDENLGGRVSEESARMLFDAAADASPWRHGRALPGGLRTSPRTSQTDIPTLIVHGTADRVLPIDGQGRRLHAALPDAHYVEIEGGAHVVCVTHAAEVNQALLSFLRHTAPARTARVTRSSLENR